MSWEMRNYQLITVTLSMRKPCTCGSLTVVGAGDKALRAERHRSPPVRLLHRLLHADVSALPGCSIALLES